ncbi:hypothetical protein AA15237_1761 [Komagataeibacter xylinus NBRC 15237]|nr:hypothetical protein AA15237_1761 [Komagataeibacter xylinus NBRC 15237]
MIIRDIAHHVMMGVTRLYDFLQCCGITSRNGHGLAGPYHVPGNGAAYATRSTANQNMPCTHQKLILIVSYEARQHISYA